MGGREEHSSDSHGPGCAGKKALQAGHEVVLQKELLIERPENVAGDVSEVSFVEGMQRAQPLGNQHTEKDEGDGGGDDPQRWKEAMGAEAKFVAAGTARQHNRQRDGESDGGEDSLQGFRGPEDGDDQQVTEDDLCQVAESSEWQRHERSMA